ncbi:MAG: ferritin-like domain-containing protein [Bacteroidota bacterium]|nr:ferritin-like domain-containing protein [Bacteroidota bacterium]MDP4212335.1 ferritin-like domain-containing protein [Bacteroidota bacterium]MDP4249693.1 ferritin-like domain-containing protein [Bacteroidota bacterium]
MKAINLFDEPDTEIGHLDVSRRQALSKGLNFGIKSALAAIPLALFFKPNRVMAATGSPALVLQVLNFALTLEYLESSFYTMGLNSSGLVPSSDTAVISQISKHETAHVATLKATIVSLMGTPVAEPTFDFTAGGMFPDVFSNYQTFLTLANAFEDTGVRAYKGQAGNLQSNPTVLTAALDIHSVEARHASEIRRIRGNKGWITGIMTAGVPAAVYGPGSPAASFPGEDNTTQGGVDITALSTFPASAASEAFDEPLDMNTVLSIATPFIKQ